MENLNPETNLLADDDYKRPLEYATVGQRFANHVVDLISFYIVFFTVTFLIVFVTGNDEIAIAMENLNPLVDRLVTLVMYAIYIGLVEGITKGRSLGKMVTRTRGVYEDGSPINFSTGFLRGIYRAVPFEPLTAFTGHPWHDKWTDTRVVKVDSLSN